MEFAIVGMALRFPGGISSAASFWEALKAEKDLVGEIEESRWPVSELTHPRSDKAGRSLTFAAGVLQNVDQFDAQFFGISPRETELMDPQQRLLLELTWESLEDAGIRPSALRGANCGVFVGISGVDYGMRSLDDLSVMGAHSMTGNTLSIAANRLSYLFDLHGPSMAIDTACSSSLVALHQACNSLRLGEASAAIVGGVNMLLHPYPFIGFSKASMLSSDGRCRAFDASGKGYVRAEGGAILIVKRLEDAEADGDKIHAVIVGTGVNTDGARKKGLTIPSVEGQSELMRHVLQQADIPPERLDYLEAHGTGTPVGDPIEVAAIGQVYGQPRAAGPLPIGSVKTNLGHLEPASGMAGLIKTVLVLKHRQIPATLHLQQPNPNIDFAGFNVEPVVAQRDLNTQADRPLLAGVNSFGFGGANAHVLLRSASPCPEVAALQSDEARLPLRISANGDVPLRHLAGQYAELIRQSPEQFNELATAAFGQRDRLRKCLLVRDGDALQVADRLECFSNNGEEEGGVVVEEALPAAAKVAFVYAGNGAQWHGMARTLIGESRLFADRLNSLDAKISAQCGISILDEIFSNTDSSRLAETEVAQPVLFAIQVALTELLESLGLRPDAVMGHSVGEVAAAWAAGRLSEDQAVQVICKRSSAQGLTRGTGRMAAVALAADEIQRLVEKQFPSMEIAGFNSDGNCTVAGTDGDIKAFAQSMDKQGVFCRVLDLDYAFHSSAMDEIRDVLLESLNDLDCAQQEPGKADFVSTVTGDFHHAKLDGDYWWRNVRKPVRFAAATRQLLSSGCRVFVEISPQPILQRYLQETLKADGVPGRILSVMRKGADGFASVEDAFLRALAVADESKLARLFPSEAPRMDLPHYPWERVPYWLPRTDEALGLFERYRVHPLLGWRLKGQELGWENAVDKVTCPWLADHVVDGAVVFPGAAYVELMLSAAAQWLGTESGLDLEDLEILSPMVFDGDQTRLIRVSINARDGGVQIVSRSRLSDEEWQLHAVGRIPGKLNAADLPSTRWDKPVDESVMVDAQRHYELATRVRLDYGAAFRGLRELHLWPKSHLLMGSLDIPASIESCYSDYCLHPALLDVCFQSLINFFEEPILKGHGVPFLPVRLGRLRLFGDGEQVSRFLLRVHRIGMRSLRAEIVLLDKDKRTVAHIEDCRFRAVPIRHGSADMPAGWINRAFLRPLQIGKSSSLNYDTQDLQQLLADCRFAFGKRQGVPDVGEYLALLEAFVVGRLGQTAQILARKRPDWLHYANNPLEELDGALRPSFHWAIQRLREEGILRRERRFWQLDEKQIPPTESIWDILLREYPEGLPEMVLTASVIEQLPQLLDGSLEVGTLAQQILDSPHRAEMLDMAPVSRHIQQGLIAAVRGSAAWLEVGQTMRVLEIGAPSTRLASSLFSFCEGPLDYTLAGPPSLTDSIQAVGERNQVFAASWNAQDGMLDLSEQALNCFDVVIVRDPAYQLTSEVALKRLAGWMSHGGLILIAGRYSDDADRLLSGIRTFGQESIDASDNLNLSAKGPDFWQTRLLKAGFESVGTIQQDDTLNLGGWLLVGRYVADAKTAEPTTPQRWLLRTLDAAEPLLPILAESLVANGHQVHIGEQNAPPATCNHLVLFASAGTELSQPAEHACAELLQLVKSHAQATPNPRLWIVTHGGALLSDSAASHMATGHGALWGIGRVLMNEYPDMHTTLIDLDVDLDRNAAGEALLNELLHSDGANEVVISPAGRQIVQLAPFDVSMVGDKASSRRYHLDFHVPGQFKNLCWLADTAPGLLSKQVEVEVVATGLNFRDVMYAMGLLPDEAVEKGFAGASLGLEFSGRVSRVADDVDRFKVGDAVMGFGSACFGSHVITREDALTNKPHDWTFEQAATVPTVFFTAYYALHHLAHLQRGERLLIHGAAGGVGIAAIQLAKHLGAEIYATAGSEEKRAFVRLLGADRVYDSRSLAFADGILAATNGEGVDVVLNSLAGEAIRRNLKILKPFGRFLELGKRDFFENTPIGLRPFKDNISYFGIDADQLLLARPELSGRLFNELMQLFEEGILYPLPAQVFEATEIVDAFRTMQQARHIGKVVIRMQDQRLKIERVARDNQQVSLRSDASYLVTGGISGFGLASARWLAKRGAGELVLVGRRGMQTPGADEAVAELQKLGARVTVKACDIGDRQAVADLLRQLKEASLPLAGVLHAAMVLDDAFVAQLDADRLHKVLAPKAWGAWYLHELTRDIKLDYFILYSSITTYIGNPGQANYVAANGYLEALASMRQAQGLPVCCIGWGPIGDVGYLTRHQAVKESLEAHLGSEPLPVERALRTMDQVLLGGQANVAIADFSWPVLARCLPAQETSRYALVRQIFGDKQEEMHGSFRQRIQGKGREEVAQLIEQVLLREIAEILGLDEDRLDTARPMREMGLDSLMGAELVVALEDQVGERLPMMLLGQSPSIDQIVEYLTDRLMNDEREESPQNIKEMNDMIGTLLDQHGVEPEQMDAGTLAEQTRNHYQ